MIFTSTEIAGVKLIDIEPRLDERGFFARTWCRHELAAHGLDVEIAQESMSYNRKKGTLRGLHFQKLPHDETKIIHCTKGAIFDVVVDLWPGSQTALRWQGFELSAENRRALYIPKGLAHGFQTLTDDTEIFYRISAPHAPDAASGYRYDDPAFGIEWPLAITVISDRDRSWPDFIPDVSSASRLHARQAE